MNLERLKRAEEAFLIRHPQGFASESLQDVIKKHSKSKITEFAQEHFTHECASNVEITVANMVKAVSRSSMVSMFEKPKFRDFCARLDVVQKGFLVDAMVEFLHGDQKQGLEAMVDVMREEKLAKWSLISVFPAYYAPTKEVFVKPTTAKGIVKYLEIDDLFYKPVPDWAFYEGYRSLVNHCKTLVDSRLSPSNAAFTGFLMMTMRGDLV